METNFNKIRNFFIKRYSVLPMLFRENKWIQKPFLILVIVYLVALSALFRADYNYNDDSQRGLLGYRLWDWSRHLSNIFAVFIHAHKEITDISPLPQILAVIFMSLAGICMIYVFHRQKKISLLQIIAVVPLGLNPWFLECFSYKFDAPYMALSILFSIIPFIWWNNTKYFLVSSILGILGMDMTYQASSGIYIMMTIALAWHQWIKGNYFKDTLYTVLIAMAGYLFSMSIFGIFFMEKQSSYASTQIATLFQIPDTIFNNLKNYLSLINFDLNHFSLVLIAVILCTFFIMSIFQSCHGKLKTGIFSIIMLILLIFFSYGGYLVLSKPLMAPRAMYGFSTFLTIIFIMGVAYSKGFKLFSMEVIILSWCMFTFALTYGNALGEQKRYTDFRIQMILEDYNRLTEGQPQKERWIQLSGDIGTTEAINRMEKTNPALKRLIPSTLGGNWYWSQHRFFHYFNLKAKQWNERQGDMKNMNLPVVVNTEYHKIQSDGTHILITLYE